MCIHLKHCNVCATDVIVLDMSDHDDFVLKSTGDVPEDSLYQLSKNAGKFLEQPKDTGDEQDQEAEVGNEGGEVVTKQSLSEEPQSTIVADTKEDNEDQPIKCNDNYSPQIGSVFGLSTLHASPPDTDFVGEKICYAE